MPTYQGIEFVYKDVQKDLQCMAGLASPFLSDGTALDTCRTQLENIRHARNQVMHKWEIPKSHAVRTRSTSRYRDGAKNGKAVYGTISFIWQIANPASGGRDRTSFHLVGIASTSVKVHSEDDDALVAMWQFEAGDADSPGCHFHSAVNQYEKSGLFPEWLKVPRFPGFLLSPMDALEFLLGELFQSDWQMHVSKQNYNRDEWSSSQRDRLSRTLRWQLHQVENAHSTPWVTLKCAKPHLEVLKQV